MDPTWAFAIDLTGVKPASGARDVPTGYYKGTVTDAGKTVASTGREQVTFKVSITDPAEFGGVIRTTRINVPTGDNDNVKFYWRALLESIGYTPAQIDQGTVKMSRELVINREACFHYKAGDRDAGVYDETTFLAPADWASRKRADEATGSRAAGPVGAVVAGAGLGLAGGAAKPPTGNNAGGMSSEAIRAALGAGR
jgi:hypothetical protein